MAWSAFFCFSRVRCDHEFAFLNSYWLYLQSVLTLYARNWINLQRFLEPDAWLGTVSTRIDNRKRNLMTFFMPPQSGKHNELPLFLHVFLCTLSSLFCLCVLSIFLTDSLFLNRLNPFHVFLCPYTISQISVYTPIPPIVSHLMSSLCASNYVSKCHQPY